MRVGTSPSNRPPVKIGFLGFHKLFHPNLNHVTRSLLHRFVLDVSEVGPDGHLDPVPDFLFISVFETNGRNLQERFSLFGSVGTPGDLPLYRDSRYDNCVKIHISDECLRPPWDECDYAITCDHDPDPRHLRLPVYVRDLRFLLSLECVKEGDVKRPNLSLSKNPDDNWTAIRALKTKFCAFIVSNPYCDERNRFFELLSKYRPVDSGGSVLNNLGYRVADKIPFLESYKFTIAFENASYPGYVTEKVFDAMVSRSVPIYWGSPTIDADLRTESLVVATGRRLEDVVDEVIALDQDEDLYCAKMREPWFHGNVPNQFCQPDYLGDFVEKIISQSKIARGCATKSPVVE